MDSLSEAGLFTYNPNANEESEHAFSGILEIHVHHAKNIHNICIYDNQDVYAKFSLTYNPDETLSTRIINGGGKNPEFNEDLIMKIHQADAVLKCEIWMMSRAKNYMDDQLLGFALVPISSISGEGKVTQDLDLSSTDLFHSPAGTIKLSLSLNNPLNNVSFADSCSATCQLLMDKKIPEDYCRIEFPDINVVSENQQMVSEYFAKNGRVLLRPWSDGSFLHLGARSVEDCEMTTDGNSSSVSPDGSIQTMSSLSDDRNSVDSMEKKGRFFADFSTSPDETPTPSSKKKSQANGPNFSGNEEEMDTNKLSDTNRVGLVGNIKLGAEESVMQKQIVDMYMRSMQQFTESLAKMKLPMDLDKPGIDNQGDFIRDTDEKIDIEKKEKRDHSRVFYGSRAFF